MGTTYDLYDPTTKRVINIDKARYFFDFEFSGDASPFSGVTAAMVREFAASAEGDEWWTHLADWMGDGATWRLHGDTWDQDAPFHDKNGDERTDWTYWTMEFTKREPCRYMPVVSPAQQALRNRLEHHLLHGATSTAPLVPTLRDVSVVGAVVDSSDPRRWSRS